MLFAGLTSLSAQHKWDKDSIYLAEFGRDTVVAPDVAPFAVHVSPFRALVGIVGVDAEVQLDQNKSLLFGFTHASALYRYGQPNVPEQSLLLNHYGSYIYEEWIFENVMAVDSSTLLDEENPFGAIQNPVRCGLKQICAYTLGLHHRHYFQYTVYLQR